MEFEAEDLITSRPTAEANRRNTSRSSLLDSDTDIASLQPGGWLTDTVITQYFQYLRNRSVANDTKCEFLSAQFYNRLYDPVRKDIRSHLKQSDNSERNALGYTELDELRAMHDHGAIFQHDRVYIPVPQPQHWGLLEVDNITRTITYMDSFRNGGSVFTQVLMDYLVQYERECNMPARPQWRKRHSMCTATTLWSTLVRVPKQDNGNDCGVFTCLFADLLERGQDVMNAGPSKIPLARERLLSSLHDKIALPLIDIDDINAHRISSTTPVRIQTGSAVVPSQASTATHHDSDESSYAMVGEKAATHDVPVQGCRRSSRSNKVTASMAEPDIH